MKLILLFLLLFCAVDSAEAYKFASGSYSGTGSGFTVDISDTTTPSVADFQPTMCLVKGEATSGDAVIRIDGMPANQSNPVDGSAAITNGITALTSNGFTISTGAQVNSSSVVYHYWCMAGDANNDYSYGTYAGNSTNNRDIVTSPAFRPEIVLVIRAQTGSDLKIRTDNGHSGDVTSSGGSNADQTDRIDQINADGFRVDNQATVNTTGNDYFYITIKNVSGSVNAGSFTGDTDDGRLITVGFQPEIVFVKGASATTGPVMRFKDNSGDESCIINSEICNINMIQTYETTGFTVGTDSAANETTVLMHWFAIRESAISFGPMRRRAQ